MSLGKILLLVAIGIICVNARRIRRTKQICQRPVSGPPCNCPIQYSCNSILEPTYGGIGTCNCQNIFLDELLNYGFETYGVLNPEVSNYGRVPAIKLPNVITDFDGRAPVPAINLPGLYDFIDYPPYQAMPPYGACPSQGPAYKIIESPCNCRPQRPIVEYLAPEVPSPFLTVPYSEPCYPPCKSKTVLPCGCQNPCGCKNQPCQNCMNAPCSCDKMYRLPYGYQNPVNCGCQNVQYGSQLPVLDAPCNCQGCQLSPVELPVFGYGCQSLPPPVVGCAGKYLRQVTLQPPFL